MAAFKILLGLGTGRTPTPYELIRGARTFRSCPPKADPNILVCLKQPDKQKVTSKKMLKLFIQPDVGASAAASSSLLGLRVEYE